MVDSYNRKINYLRISVTDRCNMRCVYCMPECGVKMLNHDEILTYEEIIRITKIFAELGITKVRLTGGEPLVRKDLPSLVRGIKEIQGIERVVMTTNGLLLKDCLDELVDAGLDSVNFSLDSLEEDVFAKITRVGGVQTVLEAIELAEKKGLSVKVNAVATSLNENYMIPLAEYFLKKKNVPLRFIEMMPIGEGKKYTGCNQEEIIDLLSQHFGGLREINDIYAGKNCNYYKVDGYVGKVGFISPMSHKFCNRCNRVRLTSDGYLKTCLQFDSELNVKAILNKEDSEILETIQKVIYQKHCEHSGWSVSNSLDDRIMAKIGG